MTQATLGDDGSLRTPLSPDECEMVRSELQTIVSSPYFRNSRRYPAFLTYIVEKTLRGEAFELKERTIGIEVFGRPADYDTNSDPTVRNTASEVRKRLSLYHAETPNNALVSIYLPLGSYHPELRFAPETLPIHRADPPSEQLYAAQGIFENQAVSATDVPRKLRLRWLVWAAPLLLLAISGGLWWLIAGLKKSPFEKLWTGFIKPAQSVIIVIPQAPAPVPAAALDGGPPEQKDLSDWIKDNPDVAAEDLSAIIQATKPLMEHNVSYSIRMDSGVTLADLRDRPIILIGGPTNAWTMKFLSPLRFHFIVGTPLYIQDAQNPQARQWGYIVGGVDSTHLRVVEDCSIVARFHDPTTGGVLMILAGAGRNGTEAAGQFVTSHALLEQLDKRLPPGWKDRNLEVVLKTRVIDGKTGSPSIEATYLW